MYEPVGLVLGVRAEYLRDYLHTGIISPCKYVIQRRCIDAGRLCEGGLGDSLGIYH